MTRCKGRAYKVAIMTHPDLCSNPLSVLLMHTAHQWGISSTDWGAGQGMTQVDDVKRQVREHRTRLENKGGRRGLSICFLG